MVHSLAFREETIDMSYHFRSGTVFIAFKKQLRIFCIDKEEPINLMNQQSNPNLSKQATSKMVSYKLR